ncbi:hypothetical protein AAMO2058_001368400 [Amorphochlora amoebiformis]
MSSNRRSRIPETKGRRGNKQAVNSVAQQLCVRLRRFKSLRLFTANHNLVERVFSLMNNTSQSRRPDTNTPKSKENDVKLPPRPPPTHSDPSSSATSEHSPNITPKCTPEEGDEKGRRVLSVDPDVALEVYDMVVIRASTNLEGFFPDLAEEFYHILLDACSFLPDSKDNDTDSDPDSDNDSDPDTESQAGNPHQRSETDPESDQLHPAHQPDQKQPRPSDDSQGALSLQPLEAVPYLVFRKRWAGCQDILSKYGSERPENIFNTLASMESGRRKSEVGRKGGRLRAFETPRQTWWRHLMIVRVNEKLSSNFSVVLNYREQRLYTEGITGKLESIFGEAIKRRNRDSPFLNHVRKILLTTPFDYHTSPCLTETLGKGLKRVRLNTSGLVKMSKVHYGVRNLCVHGSIRMTVTRGVVSKLDSFDPKKDFFPGEDDEFVDVKVFVREYNSFISEIKNLTRRQHFRISKTQVANHLRFCTFYSQVVYRAMCTLLFERFPILARLSGPSLPFG